MNRITRIVITSIFTILLAFSLWYFSDLVTFLIISVVLSIVGRPLVKFLSNLKIRNFQIPKALAAMITLIVEVIFVISIVLLFIPIVSHQASVISNIDSSRVSNNLMKTIQNVDKKLIEYGLIEKDEPLEVIVEEKVTQVINVATFSNIIKNLLSFTGNFFIGGFSVLFMTFFFLKEEHLFSSVILLITPPQHSKKIKNIPRKTRVLLTRFYRSNYWPSGRTGCRKLFGLLFGFRKSCCCFCCR